MRVERQVIDEMIDPIVDRVGDDVAGKIGEFVGVDVLPSAASLRKLKLKIAEVF